jgi:hypothetical protein
VALSKPSETRETDNDTVMSQSRMFWKAFFVATEPKVIVFYTLFPIYQCQRSPGLSIHHFAVTFAVIALSAG